MTDKEKRLELIESTIRELKLEIIKVESKIERIQPDNTSLTDIRTNLERVNGIVKGLTANLGFEIKTSLCNCGSHSYGIVKRLPLMERIRRVFR